MLYSIIIPIYNVEQYLEDCLNSVISQTYRDFEVICVNDGSTDNSLSILQAFANKDSRIVVINQQNKGQSEARNVGLKLAKGEYVLFVDSDDWIAKDALEVLDRHVAGQDFIAFQGENIGGLALASGAEDVVNETLNDGWSYFGKYVRRNRPLSFVCVFLRMYRRRFLMEHGLSFEKGICHEDNLFTPLACYHADKVSTITETLYYHRVREGSIMTSETLRSKKNRDIILVANKLAAFFEHCQVEKTALNRYLAGLYVRVFLPENKQSERENELAEMIDWNRFRQVCTDSRNRWSFRLLRISPKVFRTCLNGARALRLK